MSTVRKDNAKKLAAGYSKTKRAVEIVSMTSYAALFLHSLVRTGRYLAHDPAADTSGLGFTLATSIIGAILLADFVSGVAHWLLDTYGSPETFIWGALIRSFREHHVDQMAMTKHDMIETNGDNTMACVPMLAIISLMPITNAGVTAAAVHIFVITFAFFISITNQCHKWSHEARPHPIARFCMKYWIILNPQAHRKHHSGNHDHSYCITTGWMNPVLDATNFWRIAESAVEAVTGVPPRINDIQLMGGETAEGKKSVLK